MTTKSRFTDQEKRDDDMTAFLEKLDSSVAELVRRFGAEVVQGSRKQLPYGAEYQYTILLEGRQTKITVGNPGKSLEEEIQHQILSNG